jgi:hypothetical protein
MIYPPGPAWLLVEPFFFCLTASFTDVIASRLRYILGDGIPSNGTKVMIGTGADPPSSAEASLSALTFSKKLHAQYQYKNLTRYTPPYVPGGGP